MAEWSQWSPFPNPHQKGILFSPFGPGVYQLRNIASGQLVLFGRGKNLAYRMSSLLPAPYGSGTRNNAQKQGYVLEHLPVIEYRTLPCLDEAEAISEENKLKRHRDDYLFPT